ncbi:hypothetical protein Gogos_010120, partial [Gossypium gossypioides]|nr:hypothetical protein [Gossypium gossypioides]
MELYKRTGEPMDRMDKEMNPQKNLVGDDVYK